MHDIPMTPKHGWVVQPSTHQAGLACEVVSHVAGLPLDPARLRAWHTREGLEIVGAEGRGWRRYNDADLLALVLMRTLVSHGIAPADIAPVLENVWPAIELAMHRAENSAPPGDDVFVCAVRREGKALTLFGGERDETVEKAVGLAAFAPVTMLNLSAFAVLLRRDLEARRQASARA